MKRIVAHAHAEELKGAAVREVPGDPTGEEQFTCLPAGSAEQTGPAAGQSGLAFIASTCYQSLAMCGRYTDTRRDGAMPIRLGIDAPELPYAKGFKQISPENLLKPDEHPSYPSRLRGDRWVRECLKPQLTSAVPVEVAFLFEVARGSLVYGMYFLPLAALATEQGFRVLEAGARHRCKQLGLLKKKSAKLSAFPDSHFVDLVAALQKAGGIPKGDLAVWKSMVSLPNLFSHPTSQCIRTRHEAIEQLANIAKLLNRLFKFAMSQYSGEVRL